MPLLAHLDQATGLPIRKPTPVRYEAAAPGDLVHLAPWELIARESTGSPPDQDPRSSPVQALVTGCQPGRGT